MKSELHHKGYIGSIEVDRAGNAIVGKLLFIADVIAYSADKPAGIEAAFREAVDEYIRARSELGTALRRPPPTATW